MDALTQKIREEGRIFNVAVVIAVGVNTKGHREVRGLDVIDRTPIVGPPDLSP